MTDWSTSRGVLKHLETIHIKRYKAVVHGSPNFAEPSFGLWHCQPCSNGWFVGDAEGASQLVSCWRPFSDCRVPKVYQVRFSDYATFLPFWLGTLMKRQTFGIVGRPIVD